MIINIGRVPPPYGGVSIFLRRFKECLDKANINNILYDVSGQDKEYKAKIGIYCHKIHKICWNIILMKPSIVIFHGSNIICLLALYFFKIKHKTVLFIHGESLIINKNKLKGFLISKIDHIVVPTDLLKKKMSNEYTMKNIHSIPFILYPVKFNIMNDMFVKNFKIKFNYTLSAYAYRLSFYNNQDLYGVDMLVSLVKKLSDAKYNVGLILLLPNIDNEKYYDEIKLKIKMNNIENNILILSEPMKNAIELYASSDIYVRPSNTDGDSFL